LWVPISCVSVLLAERTLSPSPLFGAVPALGRTPSALAEPLVLPKNGKIRKKVRGFLI